jgi:hypothetical protein
MPTFIPTVKTEFFEIIKFQGFQTVQKEFWLHLLFYQKVEYIKGRCGHRPLQKNHIKPITGRRGRRPLQ